jgi:hypothetical protein
MALKAKIVAGRAGLCKCGASITEGEEALLGPKGEIVGCPACHPDKAARPPSPLQLCLRTLGERLLSLDLANSPATDIFAAAERLSLVSALLTRHALSRTAAGKEPLPEANPSCG